MLELAYDFFDLVFDIVFSHVLNYITLWVYAKTSYYVLHKFSGFKQHRLVAICLISIFIIKTWSSIHYLPNSWFLVQIVLFFTNIWYVCPSFFITFRNFLIVKFFYILFNYYIPELLDDPYVKRSVEFCMSAPSLWKNPLIDDELLKWASDQLPDEEENEQEIEEEEIEEEENEQEENEQEENEQEIEEDIIPLNYEPISQLTKLYQENLSQVYFFQDIYDVKWNKATTVHSGECALCHDDILPNQAIGDLQCFHSHTYHRKCLMNWWKITSENIKHTVHCPVHYVRCPACNKQIKFNYPLGTKKIAFRDKIFHIE